MGSNFQRSKVRKPTEQPAPYFERFANFVVLIVIILLIIGTIVLIKTQLIRPFGWDIRKWHKGVNFSFCLPSLFYYSGVFTFYIICFQQCSVFNALFNKFIQNGKVILK
jgi:hypothetical protein